MKSTIPERRTTKQRAVILGIVQASHAHPDAEEVYRLARKTIKSISLGTVYRNLKLLVEERRILEVQLNGRALRYDGMLEEHEHFLCTNCNRVIDLPRTAQRMELDTRLAIAGCEIMSYRLDLYGVCSKCIAKRQNKKT